MEAIVNQSANKQLYQQTQEKQQTPDQAEQYLWLQQTTTQKMLRKLELLRQQRLELAASKNQSTQITELELRRCLSEATGIKVALDFLNTVKS